MSIWPFKAKPNVLPFSSDYSTPVIQIFAAEAVQFHVFTVPDNQYIIPLCIRVPIALGAGAHAATGPRLFFSRGANIFASSGIALTAASFAGSFTYSPLALISAVATYPRHITVCMPPDLHLYPMDTITFDQTNFVALDTAGPAFMLCKLWEIY